MATRTVVKASDISNWPPRSELSNVDIQMPPFRTWVRFFYSYSVSPDAIELALSQTLSRYGELAGRVVIPEGTDQPYVELNNAGALLIVEEPSKLTLKEIQKTNYNNDFLFPHFGFPDLEDDGLLCKVLIQRLACGGMHFGVGCHHKLCDINSMYIFAADLASQMRSGSFLYPQSEMLLYKRSEVFHGKDGYEGATHPDLVVMTEKEKQQMFQDFFAGIQLNPPKGVKLYISSEQMKHLKSEILADYTGDSTISTNDCILSVLQHARLQTLESEPEDIVGFQFICNTRFRMDPPLPKTFFGNALHGIPLKRSLQEWKNSSLLETACDVRRTVLKFNNDRIQSTVAFLKSNYHSSKFSTSSAGINSLTVTNWNRYFDWYGGIDLGDGAPAKLVFISNLMSNMAIISPHETDGIEILMGVLEKHYEKFASFPPIKKYFELF